MMRSRLSRDLKSLALLAAHPRTIIIYSITRQTLSTCFAMFFSCSCLQTFSVQTHSYTSIVQFQFYVFQPFEPQFLVAFDIQAFPPSSFLNPAVRGGNKSGGRTVMLMVFVTEVCNPIMYKLIPLQCLLWIFQEIIYSNQSTWQIILVSRWPQ